MHSGHSIPANYSHTPTPLPPPPREVIVEPATTLGVLLFHVPFILASIGLLFALIFQIIWAIFGSDLPGTVTGATIHYGKGVQYSLEYSFQSLGTMESGSDTVDYTTYQRFQNPKLLPAKDRQVVVRYFVIGPVSHSHTKEYGFMWTYIILLVTLAAGFNGLTFGRVYQIWIKRRLIAALVRNGHAVPGKLISKRSTESSKNPRYFATYSFRVAATGEEIETETESQNFSGWNAAQEGQAVTVLYSASNPRRSTVYELGEFIIER